MIILEKENGVSSEVSSSIHLTNEFQLNPKIAENLKAYRRHVNLIRHIGERTLEELQFLPRFVFLNTAEGVSIARNALLTGWPIIIEGGSTFGTAFIPEIREDVAIARKEIKSLERVSIATDLDHVLEWIDWTKVDQRLAEKLKSEDGLKRFENIAFIRLPANNSIDNNIEKYALNKNHEIQVFLFNKEHPLLNGLSESNVNYFFIRSANISGKPEESFLAGVYDYAQEIGVPVIALISKGSLISNNHTKRMGSFPIVRITKPYSNYSFITLVRSGNTSPETMKRLLKDFLKDGIEFVHWEEKPNSHRKQYKSPWYISDPEKIAKDLLQASGYLSSDKTKI